MLVRCICKCHRSIEAIPTPFYVGVDVRDPVAAVTACSQCLNNHAPALLDPESKPADEPRIIKYLPPQPYDPTEDAG